MRDRVQSPTTLGAVKEDTETVAMSCGDCVSTKHSRYNMDPRERRVRVSQVIRLGDISEKFQVKQKDKRKFEVSKKTMIILRKEK